ncbi:TPA: hypothetical protein WHY55_000540 [Neisseria meningitidis]
MSVSDFAGVIARPVAPSLILIFQLRHIAAKLGGVFQQRGRLSADLGVPARPSMRQAVSA